MKPDYKNWIPKGMVRGFNFAFLGLCAALVMAALLAAGTVRTVLLIVFGVLALAFLGLSIWSVMMYRAFDYNGKRCMSRQIIEGTAEYVRVPRGGKCLDVGCGSGALSIAVAKRNPEATVTGIDRWGKEYASFSKNLCEQNARAEGVKNVSFRQGDATHLDFADEGGTFVIHDIMSASKYGDMHAFVKKLKDMGYERAELIGTTSGKFMKRSEAGWMGLSGSALLIGKK